MFRKNKHHYFYHTSRLLLSGMMPCKIVNNFLTLGLKMSKDM